MATRPPARRRWGAAGAGGMCVGNPVSVVVQLELGRVATFADAGSRYSGDLGRPRQRGDRWASAELERTLGKDHPCQRAE